MALTALQATYGEQVSRAALRIGDTQDNLRLPGSNDGFTSPVHVMRAQLEQAVFTSFSAKEAAPMQLRSRLRVVGIIAGAAIGSWALFAAGHVLKLY